MFPMISANKHLVPVASLPTLTVGAASVVSKLILGFTAQHTESNADFDATTKGFMNEALSTLNTHMIGFGATVSQASADGTVGYDFTSLDQRFGYPAQSNGWCSTLPANELCVTLCGCRPYQRSDPVGAYTANPLGTPTNTELTVQFQYIPPWINLGDTTSSHYGKLYMYVADCAAIAARYPHVKYFQVWNELKGFYSASLGRWWYEGYTRMFNQVAAAIHAARPDAKVIGPYPVGGSFGWDQTQKWADGQGGRATLNGPWGYANQQILDVFTYFLSNQVGCDYISYDIRNNNSDYNADNYKPLLSTAAKTWPYSTSYYWQDDPWDSSAKIRAFNAWLLARTNLPIWVNEWYGNPVKEFDLIPGDGVPLSSSIEKLSVIMRNLFAAIESGTTGLLFWRVTGEGATDVANPIALWIKTTKAATVLKDPLAYIKANFSAGAQLYTVTSNHPDVSGMASATKLILVSRSPLSITIVADGVTRTLAPYDVQFITR